MSGWITHRLTCRRGSVSIEFALIGLMLVALLIAIEEYSRLLWLRQTLQTAATATARCASIGCCVLSSSSSCSSDAAAYAADLLKGLGINDISTSAVTVDRTASCVSGVSSSFTQVTIQLNGASLLPSLIPSPTGNLSGSACFPNASTP